MPINHEPYLDQHYNGDWWQSEAAVKIHHATELSMHIEINGEHDWIPAGEATLISGPHRIPATQFRPDGMSWRLVVPGRIARARTWG